jgi:hypothetical protein
MRSLDYCGFAQILGLVDLPLVLTLGSPVLLDHVEQELDAAQQADQADEK